MKKVTCSLGKLVIISSLAISSIAGAVDLGPTSTSIVINCPYTQGGPNVLTNFGSYIAGYGTENILSQYNQIYFITNGSIDNVPSSLTNYYCESVAYNSTTSTVTCNYQSSLPTEPLFSVSYSITNGIGGAVVAQTGNSINILLPLGFAKK